MLSATLLVRSLARLHRFGAGNEKLVHQALQQKLSPGTKFKWAITMKDQLRLLIKDIDDWLERLRTCPRSASLIRKQ